MKCQHVLQFQILARKILISNEEGNGSIAVNVIVHVCGGLLCMLIYLSSGWAVCPELSWHTTNR